MEESSLAGCTTKLSADNTNADIMVSYKFIVCVDESRMTEAVSKLTEQIK